MNLEIEITIVRNTQRYYFKYSSIKCLRQSTKPHILRVRNDKSLNNIIRSTLSVRGEQCEPLVSGIVSLQCTSRKASAHHLSSCTPSVCQVEN